jgi:hypothetical protein
MSLPHTELAPHSQRYEHSSLDKDRKEIRLVQIKPDVDSTNPIQLILKTAILAQHDDANNSHQASLEEQESAGSANPTTTESELGFEHIQTGGSFVALSYAWGPETPLSDVHIEDSSGSGWLSVRQNLHDFLTTRRDSSVYSPWFWIDQLCINQSDDQEKGHQVNQMSQIYSTAIQVEVWLGLSFEGSDEAMHSLCQAAINPTSVTAEELLNHNPAVEKISRLPYWSRVWIVQEIILGNDVWVRLGNKTAPWPAAFSSIKGDTVEPLNLWSRNLSRPLSVDWSMVHQLTIWRECANVRDRIFAMMGLVVESLWFYPDYSMPLQDTLLTMLRSQIDCFVSLVSEHSKRLSGEKCSVIAIFQNIEKCAQDWYWTLDQEHREIDPKAVRSFLLEQFRRILQGPPLGAHVEAIDSMKLRLTIPLTTLGNGPTILARLRFRLLLPNRNSMLWHYWHRKKITPRWRII